MRYYLFLIVVHFTTNLFGQCNPAIPPKEIKSYPIKRISLLTEKETAYEIVKREIKASDKIIKVYEIETWQPNNKVAKTIIANVITKFDDSLTIDKLLIYYPIDSSSFGEFLLDTFKTNKPSFKIQSVFTADFDNDSVIDIGLIYSYAFLTDCNNSLIYRTVYYKKPKYLGVNWEFIFPIFVRIKDERFDCTQSPCSDREYCKYDNEKSIRLHLNIMKNK